MAENRVGWLAPGARRHVARMLSAVVPCAATVDRRLGARLKRATFPAGAVPLLLAIAPPAAARSGALDTFFAQAERNGRELARLGITPEQATAVLRDCD